MTGQSFISLGFVFKPHQGRCWRGELMDAADLLRAPGDGRTSAHSRVIISFMFLTRPFSGGCLISVSGADGPPGRAGVSSHCQVVSKRHVPLDAFYFSTARLRRGRKKKGKAEFGAVNESKAGWRRDSGPGFIAGCLSVSTASVK